MVMRNYPMKGFLGYSFPIAELSCTVKLLISLNLVSTSSALFRSTEGVFPTCKLTPVFNKEALRGGFTRNATDYDPAHWDHRFPAWVKAFEPPLRASVRASVQGGC